MFFLIKNSTLKKKIDMNDYLIIQWDCTLSFLV